MQVLAVGTAVAIIYAARDRIRRYWRPTPQEVRQQKRDAVEAERVKLRCLTGADASIVGTPEEFLIEQTNDQRELERRLQHGVELQQRLAAPDCTAFLREGIECELDANTEFCQVLRVRVEANAKGISSVFQREELQPLWEKCLRNAVKRATERGTREAHASAFSDIHRMNGVGHSSSTMSLEERKQQQQQQNSSTG